MDVRLPASEVAALSAGRTHVVPDRPRPDRPRRPAVAALLLAGLALGRASTATAASPARERPASAAPAEARVEQVLPSGTVKEPAQVTVAFSTPMVALGDPRAPAPASVECAPAATGRGRWVDSRHWVLDFDKPLPGGVRCTIAISSGLSDLSGATLPARAPGEFSTGGPSIVSSQPSGGSTIDEDQAFALELDAAATRESVEAHAWLVAAGIPEKIGVAVADDATRDAVLAAIRSEDSWWQPTGPVVVLVPKRRLPPEAEAHLVWGPGIATPGGVATGSEAKLDFTVRPSLRGEVRCQRESARAGCVPITPISVAFTTPVAASAASRVALVGPDGTRFPQDPPESEDPLVSRVRFRGPFPPKSRLALELPDDLSDGSDRPLSNLDELRRLPVEVDAMPPLAKFAARLGVIEAGGDPALPVTIRGLEPDVQVRLRTIAGATGNPTAGGALVTGRVRRLSPDRTGEIQRGLLDVAWASRDRSILGEAPAGEVATVPLPRPDGEAMQVVGLPLPGPGVYVVELASTELGRALLGTKAPMYVQTAAIVTDLAVHFERGPGRSLAWVTSLRTGKPVAGAAVAVHDCAGSVIATATTGGDGIAWFDRLPTVEGQPSCKAPPSSEDADAFREWDSELVGLAGGLLVTARLGDDLGLASTAWTEGIDLFRFDLPFLFENAPGTRAHTVLARNLLRAGDTAHMKHFLRSAIGRGFGLLPAAERPTTVVFRHDGSGAETSLPLAWNADGTATTDWSIPREAKLGLYRVVLRRPSSSESASPSPTPRPTPTPRWPYDSLPDGSLDSREWESGEFRVEEFRVPLLATTLRLPTGPEIAPREVVADLASTFLAGGPAKGLPVVVRSRVVEDWLDLPAPYSRLSFTGGPVVEGVRRRSGNGTSEESSEAEPGTDGSTAPTGVFRREEVRLDGTGSARVAIAGVPAVTRTSELQVEAEVRDPNGESQTTTSKVRLWPTARVVGISADADPRHRRRGTAEIAVLDTSLRPVAGARVDVDLFTERTYTTRQRVVGGFFAWQNVTETRRAGSFCHGRTGVDGRLRCRHSLPEGHDFVLQARTRDDAGRVATATALIWLPGNDADWSPQTDDDRMDVIPERKSWEPGETARLRADLPFREASALVSVAREGVLDARVVTLGRGDGGFEIPILPSYSPNVFVHVLAVRGRVGSIQPTATLDLGKPAFRLGIAPIDVGWKPHRLDVRVLPEREVFHPREKARVRVEVRSADGTPLAPGASVSLAAIDEGLVRLMPNGSWKLLEAMMSPRPDRVETATSMLHVIGKRHFGKKARPDGGGGGNKPTREMFDTLLLWRGTVALDRDGRAEVEVPLNDSLTAFRIAAVAESGVDRFGTGEASIRSTQDLMLLSGLPPVVRGGDRFAAPFTVRNASDRPLDVTVRARADGLPAPDLGERTMKLGPGESRIATWDVTVPVGIDGLGWQVEARASGAPSGAVATDRLAVRERVVPSVPVRTLQATLAQWSSPGPLVQPVAAPAGAVPGAGGIDVGIAPGLGAGLDGVRAWMRDYPYTCLEQRVSRAVAIGDPALWKDVVGRLPSLQDGDGLLRFFPSMPRGSLWLTGYVLDVAHQAGLALPSDVEDKMKSALRSFVGGNLRVPDGGGSDLVPRRMSAIAALAAAGGETGADPALLAGIEIEPSLWPTHTVLDWWQVLRRTPAVPDREARMREAEGVLRARLDLSGTTLAFAADRRGRFGDGFGSEDVDALRLVQGAVESGAFADDQGRLMRGALARQSKGAWLGTVANAWGTIATRRFVETHEKEPVDGRTTATLAGSVQSVDWAKEPGGRTLSFAWPAAGADLAIDHRGAGRPWATVRTRAAVPLAEPLSAGFRIRRTVEPIERRSPDRWSVGDTMRVRIEVEAAAEQGWTVVDDPVPPGASWLARGFSTDSALAAAGTTPAPGSSPTFEERAFEGLRAYWESIGAGRLVAEYSIRLNQAGVFRLPPTHVEALYAPEVMAEAPILPLEVVE